MADETSITGVPIRFGVLGSLTVHRAGRSVTVAQAMLRRLLALLLCRAGAPMSLEVITDALWRGSPPPSARKTAQVYVHRLRRMLADEHRISFGPGGYQLLVAPGELDADVFVASLRTASAAREHGDIRSASDLLREALTLWRGSAYAGIDDISIVSLAAERLEERRLAAIEERVGLDLELGRLDTVVDELPAIIAAHPYREQLRGLQMMALWRAGRQADALAVYRDTRDLLGRSLGVKPMPYLQQLHRRILAQDATGPDPPQVAAATRPAQPAKHEPPVRWSAPAPLADFVGRTAELARLAVQLHNRLDGGLAAVVAISGLPGVGKTALAIAAGHRLRHRFPAGQLYVDLHGHAQPRSPYEVLSRLLRTMEVPAAAIPGDLEEAVQAYRSHLSAAPRLVILDNAASVEQIRPLLPPAGCAVLVTSRRLLADLDGAYFLRLEPLPEEDAFRLLAVIAGREQVDRSPAAAAAIVRLCGRLPLAVRIVAGKTLHDTELTEIADRLTGAVRLLDHLTSEERSVRATFQTAYEALGEEQQRLLRFLALVTVDDFPAWVAQVTLGTRPSTGHHELDRLVAMGWVEALPTDPIGQRRYRLHDLVRYFAAEVAGHTVADPERATVVRRVAEAWHSLAEQADRMITHQGHATPALATATAPAVTAAHLRDSVAWFAVEVSSIAAVAKLAAEAGLHAQCWHLIWNCESYLRQEARTVELLSLGHLGLAAAQRGRDQLGVACMSLTLAATYVLLGDSSQGLHCARRAAATADAIGHTWLRAETRGVIASLCAISGDTAGSAQALREAVDLYEEAGELISGATKLTALAGLVAETEGSDAAAPLFGRGIAMLRDAGAPIPLARGLRQLAAHRRHTGDLTGAVEVYHECLDLLRDYEEPLGKLCVHTELALILLDLDQLDEAARHVQLARQHSEQVPSVPMYAAFARMSYGILCARQGRPVEARTILESTLADLAGRPEWQAIALAEIDRLPRVAAAPVPSTALAESPATAARPHRE